MPAHNGSDTKDHVLIRPLPRQRHTQRSTNEPAEVQNDGCELLFYISLLIVFLSPDRLLLLKICAFGSES